ncbi:MAG TPA: CHASE domain-containing protein, partial [Aquabacterium sp.]|nr:CHASE domain-containing protein [Aquabacterium sp.]
MFARLPLRPAWAQFIGLIVPLAGLLFTAWAAVGLHQTQAARSAQEFQQIADRVNTTIQQRMGQARQALRSARGLMLTTPALDRATFQTYMAAIDIDSQLPGIRGLGYIDRVAATDLPAYIARQRADGAPDFAVYPAGERDPHYVIRMIEPLARNRRAVGFDVGAEPNRTRALMQAMTSGKATSTAPIVLVQDQQKRQGVLFMLPVYRPGMPIATPAQRTAAFGGVFYMAIVLEELLADLPVVADKRVDIRLHDADSPQAGLLYRAVQGDPDHPSVGLHSETRRLEAGQRTWLVDIRSNTLFERSQDHSAPWILAVGGTLLTALLTLAWWMAISGQRRAENLAAQMTVELERMANVVKLTSNAAIIMDARMQIAWVNEAFTRLYGYTLEEARGQTMGALLGSGHSDPESLTQLDQAALTGNSGRVRVVNRTRDGTLLQIDTEVQAVYGPHGELRYLVELSQDMTAQHRTLQALEAALRETDALLGTIQQHAIVSVTDRNGRITDVNEAFCRLSGYARDELIGQDHRILNSGQQPAAFWAEMWQSISAGRPWRGEICNRAKNGSLHWVDSIIAPVLGSDGQIERFIDIRHDIT